MLVKSETGGASKSEWSFDSAEGARLFEAARSLRPLLEKEANATEAQRTPTKAVVDALDEIGIWDMAVPKRLGGKGISALDLARIGAEIAKGDPSVSWVVQILNGTTWVTTLASDAIQDEIFGSADSRVCGAFNPPGKGVPVDGGYLVTGKWPYSSGFRQAAWGQWGLTIHHPDGRVTPGNFVYIPTKQLELENSWHVTGLQGSGSDTAVCKDLFVPEHMVVHAEKPYGYHEPDKRNFGDPSDYWQQIPFVHRTGAGQVVGMAEAVLEHVSAAAKNRPVVGTFFAKQTDSHVVMRDIGEAAAKIYTARMLVESACRELDAAALARAAIPPKERARNKAQGAYAIQIMAEAVQSLMFIAGSSAFNLANPISRYYRDFNVAARHIANLPNVGFEVYGRSLLDVEPNIVPPFML